MEKRDRGLRQLLRRTTETCFPNTIDGARCADAYCRAHRDAFGQIEVIVGEEVSSSGGHILGLFLREPEPPHLSPAETVRAIHDQGGLAIAAHPFTHLLRFTGMKRLGRGIADLPLDGVEVRYAGTGLTASHPRSGDRHATHQVETVGGAFVEPIRPGRQSAV